jgi:transcriptional regulator with XRE-family HTH domain
MIVTIDGEKVKALREAAGMDRDQLAARAGISRQTVAKAERHGGPPQVKSGRKIARALGVEPRSLAKPAKRR